MLPMNGHRIMSNPNMKMNVSIVYHFFYKGKIDFDKFR